MKTKRAAGGDRARGKTVAQSATDPRIDNDRRSTNPAFNSRKLKLGTFQTNLDYGCLMADVEGRLKISWPNTVALAKLADEMEFEALVPVARWRGFGGKLNPQGPGFETYTWASGIAASTDAAGVVATSHCFDQPSDRRGETGHGDRSYLQRPLDPQHRHRLEQAGDRHVRRRDAAARRTLRHGRGMARHRQAALDRGRRIRPRGQVLQDRERLPAAEADPAALSGDHECRRLGARPPLRRQILRSRLHRARLAGLRAEQGAGGRLSQARARGIRPRDRGLDVGEYRSSRNGSRSAALSTNTSSAKKATGKR